VSEIAALGHGRQCVAVRQGFTCASLGRVKILILVVGEDRVKGIVFNLLEQAVARAHGETVWDQLLDAVGLTGAYTSLGNYPDEEIEALAGEAARMLGLSRPDVLRWFGQAAMPILAETYPAFFTPHVSARSFVMGVNDIIHAEVRKLYPGAACPHFNIRQDDAGALLMDYRSSRNLCALAQGFIEGAAAHYGEAVDFHHASCVEHGHEHCSFRIRWVTGG
jgi:hypothetical protein